VDLSKPRNGNLFFVLELYTVPLSIHVLYDGEGKDGLIQTSIIFCRKYAETRIFMSVYHRLYLAFHLNNTLASALERNIYIYIYIYIYIVTFFPLQLHFRI
jgi:hypothetical protein